MDRNRTLLLCKPALRDYPFVFDNTAWTVNTMPAENASGYVSIIEKFNNGCHDDLDPNTVWCEGRLHWCNGVLKLAVVPPDGNLLGLTTIIVDVDNNSPTFLMIALTHCDNTGHNGAYVTGDTPRLVKGFIQH